MFGWWPIGEGRLAVIPWSVFDDAVPFVSMVFVSCRKWPWMLLMMIETMRERMCHL